MFFKIKLFIGELLVKWNYLAELTVIYSPHSNRGVYFGRTWRRYKKDQERHEKLLEKYPQYRELIGESF